MRNVGNIAIRTAPENSGGCFKLGEWIWFGATDGVNDYREFCHEFKTGSQTGDLVITADRQGWFFRCPMPSTQVSSEKA